MKRSRFVELLMQVDSDEDIEIVFLGDNEGSVVIGGDGYYEVYEDDIEIVSEEGKIVAISINVM